MNFDFSEDQKLLKEQVSRFLADNCPIEIVREVLEGDDFYSEKVWKGLIDLGLTGTTIPEEYGGLGLSPLELCVIAEELGRASAPVPFSSSVYLATEANPGQLSVSGKSLSIVLGSPIQVILYPLSLQ